MIGYAFIFAVGYWLGRWITNYKWELLASECREGIVKDSLKKSNIS